MNNWHYSLNGQQLGPVNDQQIMAMIQSGQLQPTALVWKQGMADWTAISTVPELQAVAAPVATAAVSPAAPTSGGFSLGASPLAQQAGAKNPQVAAANPYATPGALGGGPQGPMPSTYLWQSICVTFLCCLPFGIVGIVNAAKVSSLYQSGNYAGAVTASQAAKKWTMLGFWIGLAVQGLVFILQIAAVASM